ncbi:MAG: hypothetical protein ACNA8L_08580 [Luteolibacter sp.]
MRCFSTGNNLRLLRRYSDTPMSFANACLVRMPEQNEGAVVFSTDSDFRLYLSNSRQMMPRNIPD